jgi:hypothetical protein
MIQQQTMPAQNLGAPGHPNAVKNNGQTFLITGKFVKTASLEKEYQEDVENPEETMRALRSAPAKIDILKFWQRVPDSEAKFNYYKEWRQIAALRFSTYQYWWEKQINRNARRMVKRAREQGVVVSEVPFTDDLVPGMMEIFNQSPIRRGKPMRHYAKSFETVKAEMGADLSTSIFVAAHYQNELIGIFKFMLLDRYALITIILDKTAHRDKAPMNAMIGKVVEICIERNAPYLIYNLWRSGSYKQFQQSNGFVNFPVPEYFVPLTFKGRLALMLRLHKGIKGLLPEKVHGRLVDLRAKWSAIKFRQKTA